MKNSLKFMSRNLTDLNREFSYLDLRSRLTRAYDLFKNRLFITSSFQTQSLVLLHNISLYIPKVPIYFIDTGFHFPETLTYRDKLKQQLKINVLDISAKICMQEKSAEKLKLYEKNKEFCCYFYKVLPVEEYLLKKYSVWISGLRKDQTNNRREMDFVENVGENLRIHPMLDWSYKDVDKYISQHNLPTHPLEIEGYRSIGCKPCTNKLSNDNQNHARGGRWAGTTTDECGLHTKIRG